MALILYALAFAALIAGGFFLTSLPFLLLAGSRALQQECADEESGRHSPPARRRVVKGLLLRRSRHLLLEYHPAVRRARPRQRARVRHSRG